MLDEQHPTQHPTYYPITVVKKGDFLFIFFFCTPSNKVAQSYVSASLSTVPGAPPRRVEVEVLNSTALKVMWRSLTPGKQNGQIRGYQVHYVRVENGESRGLPLIKDVMLADAQVRPSHTSFRTKLEMKDTVKSNTARPTFSQFIDHDAE